MPKVQKQAKKFKTEYLLIAFLSILALLIFFSSFKNNSLFNLSNSGANNLVYSNEETKLKELLSSIEGVGKTVVSVNIDNDNNKILGVVVVCEGAGELKVKLAITEAITTCLDVSSENIRILKMK